MDKVLPSIFSPFRCSQRKNYSLAERVVRLAVFQVGALQGVFERVLIYLYKMCAQGSCCPDGFNAQRAESALESFKALGAAIEVVKAKHGTIHMATFSSQELEKKLTALGATWEKISLREKPPILAIISPAQSSSAWNELENSLLKLKWEKETVCTSEGINKEVIITRRNAAEIKEEDFHTKLFLHSNSASVSFAMLFGRIGFNLGCKQTICCYDPQGTWKSDGIPSEAAYYENIEVVYERINKSFGCENIWVTAACGGCFAAAHLKAKFHDKGMNFIFENGCVDLKEDFTSPFNWIVKQFAHCFWGALKSKEGDYSLKETGFNIRELWQGLVKNKKGQVVIVGVTNDHRFPPKVTQESFTLAQRVNEQATHVLFPSKWRKNPHFDRYFNYEEPIQKVLQCIFSSN